MEDIQNKERRVKGIKVIEGLEYIKYKAQQEQEILELNTDEDKVTTITEKNIIKKVRDVYGQKAADMIGTRIDWSSWGVEMNPKERPNPYDFPAFLRAVEDVGEKKVGKHKKGEKSAYKSKRSKKPPKDELVFDKSISGGDNYSKLPTEEDLFPNDDGGGEKAGGGETALGFDENEKIGSGGGNEVDEDKKSKNIEEKKEEIEKSGSNKEGKDEKD
uniref:Uncharacterized protein n=1 Tax=Meloidogyne hapla TaxID=6305 RepID=A0A1I8AXZ3_MELHA